MQRPHLAHAMQREGNSTHASLTTVVQDSCSRRSTRPLSLTWSEQLRKGDIPLACEMSNELCPAVKFRKGLGEQEAHSCPCLVQCDLSRVTASGVVDILPHRTLAEIRRHMGGSASQWMVERFSGASVWATATAKAAELWDRGARRLGDGGVGGVQQRSCGALLRLVTHPTLPTICDNVGKHPWHPFPSLPSLGLHSTWVAHVPGKRALRRDATVALWPERDAQSQVRCRKALKNGPKRDHWS